ncbi:MAG: SDR family oxidoreductase [Akkermansia sp.]
MESERGLAIITGAAQGIGNCLAHGFAQQGYRVCALDVQPMDFSGAANIAAYQIDLADTSSIAQLFEQITQEWGQPAVLINNAAISKFSKPLGEIAVVEFEQVIATNLTGSFACAKAFVAANKGMGWGRIINMSSTRFHQNEADWEAYGASKGGIISLTNSLCVSLSGTGITVNAISPGWICCEGYEALSELDHSQHPSGRVGKPEDILRACLFLCEKGNDFINGTNLIIDGGMTKRMIYVD